MDVKRLHEILLACTAEFRKGAAATVNGIPSEDLEKDIATAQASAGAGPVVAEVWAMPHVDDLPTGLKPVDVFFEIIGVDQEKAESFKDEIVSLLRDYPKPDRLAGGPSYIEVGGELGDQGMALRLFAVGEVLKLWTVITPTTLGLEGEQARTLAGRGLVMMSHFSEGTV